MLINVIEKGTGKEAKILNWQIAGKTGTTQKSRDAWFIGYTSEYVIGVWIGNDDNTPLKKVSGGSLPTRIWKQIAEKIHNQRPQDFLEFENNYEIKNNTKEESKHQDSYEENFLKKFLNFLKTF